MPIIAVANLKGGVGKSTIAVNLACELEGRQSMTLVDADTQGTAARWGRELPINVEALPLESERDVGAWVTRVLTIKTVNVVIDCPPHVGAATSTAVGIADLVLVPVAPSAADLMATLPALALIGEAREKREGGGPECLLVPSRVDRRRSTGREIEAALKRLEMPVGPAIRERAAVGPVIRERAAFVDAFGAGEWIGEYAPRGDAYADIQALARAVKRRLR